RVCFVGASKGYPNDYSKVKGKEIFGLEDAMKCKNASLFSAGIEVKDGRFFAKGGRLFSVVGEGEDIVKARQAAYTAMALINIEGNNLHYRTDIGWRDVERHLKETGKLLR
ncbi:phosphoribosylamine--glycine ligase, partial [archaeon]|nr:phosphoribosylamine--glycine ligase [archaeon]